MTMEIDSCCKQCHRGHELAYPTVDTGPGNAIVGKFQRVLQDQRKLVMALKSFSFWTLSCSIALQSGCKRAVLARYHYGYKRVREPLLSAAALVSPCPTALPHSTDILRSGIVIPWITIIATGFYIAAAGKLVTEGLSHD